MSKEVPVIIANYPSLRGPAPLHHALLDGRKTTGVTLQTLHPNQFDKGAIIAQKEFDIPDKGNCTFKELDDYSAQAAADLLVENLSSGRHLHPGIAYDTPRSDKTLKYASKVTPEDCHIDWATWPAERVLRTQRAMQHVWSHWKSRKNGALLRVQWHDLRLVDRPTEAPLTQNHGEPLLTPAAPCADQRESAIRESLVGILPTCDNRYLECRSITIEGRVKREAAARGISLLLNGRV